MLTLDARLLAWIVAHRVHALDGFMLTITSVGRGGVVWLAIGAAFLAARRMPLTAFLSLALAILTATLLVDHALKPLVGRARPFETRGHIEIIGARPGRASFPSG